MTAEEYSPVKGTSIKLVSLTGEVIQHIRNTDLTGEALKCEVENIKIGGTNAIVFSVDRNTTIPTFPGMVVEVHKDNEKFAIAYSDTIPKPASTDPELQITCLGFHHKLDTLVVNKSYASKTLKEIIADLEPQLEAVDLFYNELLVDLPDITITELTFDDKPLRDVVQTVLQVANFNYDVIQYRWFIDLDRVLNFEVIDENPIRGLFEGFNYQAPEVEIEDTSIVNQVLAYKSDPLDTKKLVYVDTYADTDSQGKYGIRTKKLVFPDEVDNTTLEGISNSIIHKNKDPLTKVLIENLEGVDFPFAFYKLSSRIDSYWQLLSECDSFDNWDLSSTINTQVTLSEETVLTGRRSIKCVTGVGSFGESIQYNSPTPVYAPSIFRLFLYLEEAMNLEITIEATNGDIQTFELGSSEFNLEMNDTVSTVKNMEVNGDFDSLDGVLSQPSTENEDGVLSQPSTENEDGVLSQPLEIV